MGSEPSSSSSKSLRSNVDDPHVEFSQQNDAQKCMVQGNCTIQTIQI